MSAKYGQVVPCQGESGDYTIWVRMPDGEAQQLRLTHLEVRHGLERMVICNSRGHCRGCPERPSHSVELLMWGLGLGTALAFGLFRFFSH